MPVLGVLIYDPIDSHAPTFSKIIPNDEALIRTNIKTIAQFYRYIDFYFEFLSYGIIL